MLYLVRGAPPAVGAELLLHQQNTDRGGIVGGVNFAEYSLLVRGPFNGRSYEVGVDIDGLSGIGVLDGFGWFNDGGEGVVL